MINRGEQSGGRNKKTSGSSGCVKKKRNNEAFDKKVTYSLKSVNKRENLKKRLE